MAAKAHGPILEDYKRALKAARWAGWKVVRVEIGNCAIALIKDDAYLEKLATGQPPAPDTESGGKPKLVW